MSLNLVPKILPRSPKDPAAEFESQLIRAEAEIGGKLFGPVPKGHKRQFFCLDEHTWIWHEEWADKSGQRRVVTTRYSVRPSGVIKYQDGQSNQRLSVNEAVNLYKAVGLYYQHISTYYNQMLSA